MTPKHITIDPLGQIFEVTNFFDRFGNHTDDPLLAATCVIKLDNDHWVPTTTDDVSIYTVH